MLKDKLVSLLEVSYFGIVPKKLRQHNIASNWGGLATVIGTRGRKNKMILDEVSKESFRTAVKNDPFHLLLEIERRFREEERKNLHSERGRSHQNLLRIIKKQPG